MKRKNFTWTTTLLLLIAAALPASTWAQVAKYGESIEKGTYGSYVSQDGTQYNVGEKIKLGTPQGGNKTFSFINMYPGGMLIGPSPCPATCAGLEYEIIEFKQTRQGDVASLWAKMKAKKAFTGTITVNFESALQGGELIGRGYTSAQALQELKRWKDKLDLELITSEEYELKKQELSKYIK